MFTAANNQREFAGLPLPENLYDLKNYSNLKGIKMDVFHKEKIQIMVRPRKVKAVDGTVTMRYREFDPVLLSRLQNDIT